MCDHQSITGASDWFAPDPSDRGSIATVELDERRETINQHFDERFGGNQGHIDSDSDVHS